MRLTELEPKFLKLGDPISYRTFKSEGVSMAEADGIMFLCPRCFAANAGSVGTHSVICWRPRVPQHENLVGPGRWEMTGSGMADLTLVAGSSSVLLTSGCRAHFFVKGGEIQMCG